MPHQIWRLNRKRRLPTKIARKTGSEVSNTKDDCPVQSLFDLPKMAALCACALVPRRTLRLSRASIQLPEPPRLRRQPRLFSAISRGVSRVGTGAVGSAACGDTNRGVSGVGGGRELRGRRQAAARTPLSRPRLASPGRTLDASPGRPGAMRENTVLEEGRSPELPEAAPWQKGGIFRSREQPAGCDSPFAGGERCGAGQAGAAGTAPAPRSSLGVLDGLRAEEVGGVGAVRVPELLEWQLAAASCVCVWNQL